jgi:hypothetical protein
VNKLIILVAFWNLVVYVSSHLQLATAFASDSLSHCHHGACRPRQFPIFVHFDGTRSPRRLPRTSSSRSAHRAGTLRMRCSRWWRTPLTVVSCSQRQRRYARGHPQSTTTRRYRRARDPCRQNYDTLHGFQDEHMQCHRK